MGRVLRSKRSFTVLWIGVIKRVGKTSERLSIIYIQDPKT